MDLVLALSTPGWAGLSALGGALIGGLVAGGATYTVEGRRQDFERGERDRDRTREDDARRAVVRGIARALVARLTTEQAAWETALEHDVWPPSVFQRSPPLPEPDQQLLAANASAEEWAAVANAQASLSVMRDAHEYLVNDPESSSEDVNIPLEDGGRRNAQVLIASLKEARKALGRLAELHPGSA
ncbi:MAG TPA: hypothetical protein VFU33_07180 [Gaiellaceae bacterium]|nr:hypothetical protein [Gaiellaceae bacterium]